MTAPEERDDVSELEREQCEALAQRGFDLVKEGKYDEALAVAEELAAHGYTAYFEIRALALAELDQKEEAVVTLEKGVGIAPSVWLLWQLLGNYRSDLGRYDAAHDAYARALECPEVEPSSVHLNRAAALAREDRAEEAFEALAQVTDPALELRRESSRVGFLVDADRYPEAVKAARKTLDREWGDGNGGLLATVQAELAWALHRMGATRDEVEAEIWQALERERRNRRALWVLREIDRQVSNTASYYRLLVHGQVPDEYDADVNGYFVTYEVVADSPEEALALAARHQPELLRSALRIEECEALEPRPEDPKGVYWVSGLIFFPDDTSG